SPLVRPATRERVLEAARRLDYVPDRKATRLRRGQSECIAIGYASRSPNFASGAFYSLILRGVTEVLEDHGYALRFVRLDDIGEPGRPRGARRLLHSLDIDGLLLMNWHEPALMRHLCGLGVPLVAIDASGGYPTLPSVDSDDRGAVFSAI